MSSTYIGVDSSARVRRKFGASHRTSRTGVVARLIELCGHLDGPSFLEAGEAAAFAQENEFDERR